MSNTEQPDLIKRTTTETIPFRVAQVAEEEELRILEQLKQDQRYQSWAKLMEQNIETDKTEAQRQGRLFYFSINNRKEDVSRELEGTPYDSYPVRKQDYKTGQWHSVISFGSEMFTTDAITKTDQLLDIVNQHFLAAAENYNKTFDANSFNTMLRSRYYLRGIADAALISGDQETSKKAKQMGGF